LPELCTGIVFTIPDGLEQDDSSQHVSIESSISFTELLDKLHENIGCSGMKSKPKLKYRFVNVQHPFTLKLGTEEDWEGLKEDIAVAQNKKKDGVRVGVQVIVDKDVCFHIFLLVILTYSASSTWRRFDTRLGNEGRKRIKGSVINGRKVLR
jgi:hypothetical protein